MSFVQYWNTKIQKIVLLSSLLSVAELIVDGASVDCQTVDAEISEPSDGSS